MHPEKRKIQIKKVDTNMVKNLDYKGNEFSLKKILARLKR